MNFAETINNILKSERQGLFKINEREAIIKYAGGFDYCIDGIKFLSLNNNDLVIQFKVKAVHLRNKINKFLKVFTNKWIIRSFEGEFYLCNDFTIDDDIEPIVKKLDIDIVYIIHLNNMSLDIKGNI